MDKLTHIDAAGQARMVDVSDKPATARMARATGRISMRRETLDAIQSNTLKKGDVLAVARVAGIQAAKKTADLIPLCHPLLISDVDIRFSPTADGQGIAVEAEVKTTAQTGIEMEAIVAVSVSLITIYDMAKGVDKSLQIGDISLAEKVGGKSGRWVRQ